MQLEIVMKPVNEIIPYWRNPRRNDATVDALIPVIQKNGFNVPIVIDKNGVVVKGHARLKAAKRLGMAEVPCIVSDASEDVIKADRIADNKIQELSSWDFGKLDAELDRLDGMEFKALFRLDENPVADADELPDVEFKPAGLQYWGGGYYGEDAQTPTQTGEEVQATHYEGAQVVSGGGFEYRHEETQTQPQTATGAEKRTLKTLCPYCGKVVFISV